MIKVMPDGTEKQFNPFTGNEVWIIPDRKNRPMFTKESPTLAQKVISQIEKQCHFCPGNYFYTPPEKSRLILNKNQYIFQDRVDPQMVNKQYAEFRRIPNLFEIVTIDYWKKNYSYFLTPQNQQWKEHYLSSETGKNHVLSVIDLKLKYSNFSEQDIKELSVKKKLTMADAFFGGGHEVIIPRRHYINGAQFNNQLTSSGELSPEEHFQYIFFTISAMHDIFVNNRYVRYISVFQNWGQEAGASIVHLHKQLIALDECGHKIEQKIELTLKNKNLYNEHGLNVAVQNGYVLCENEYALAFVDVGHRHPTIAIYSKSATCDPKHQTQAEIRGFSDIMHAIHAATGSAISSNEEWYYLPRDSVVPMPWHVLIKWRINIQAGFEGGTNIFVNPMSLVELREQIVPKLYQLKSQGKIADIKIFTECSKEQNALKYYRNNK